MAAEDNLDELSSYFTTAGPSAAQLSLIVLIARLGPRLDELGRCLAAALVPLSSSQKQASHHSQEIRVFLFGDVGEGFEHDQMSQPYSARNWWAFRPCWGPPFNSASPCDECSEAAVLASIQAAVNVATNSDTRGILRHGAAAGPFNSLITCLATHPPEVGCDWLVALHEDAPAELHWCAIPAEFQACREERHCRPTLGVVLGAHEDFLPGVRSVLCAFGSVARQSSTRVARLRLGPLPLHSSSVIHPSKHTVHVLAG